MKKNVLVLYKSVTGFTKEYAELITQEMDGTIMDCKNVTSETMSKFDIIIFGGRMHAGRIDGLKQTKKLFLHSNASHFIIFATGASPNNAKDTIEEMWRNNLAPAELTDFPHFYMQSGLRYEKMPFLDKIMMKMFCSMMKKKKDKTDYEKQFVNIITHSYDISSKTYIMPLINYVTSLP